MSNIIDGKLVSQQYREILKNKILALNKTGIYPSLAVILVGDNPASQKYVRNKEIACEKVGIKSIKYVLPSDTNETELTNLISELNNDSNVNGILLQLPLPKHLNELHFLNLISPAKDVDSFNPYNIGKLFIDNSQFNPCTPAGIMELLRYYNVNLDGKRCVIIGRSNIVGKPLFMMFLKENATTTLCHSHTKDLTTYTRDADVIVVAVGKSKFLKADMIKDGAVIIDVGINVDAEGHLVGDVDFDEVVTKASLITPVPGGVGPMTITMLLENTIKAAELQNK